MSSEEREREQKIIDSVKTKSMKSKSNLTRPKSSNHASDDEQFSCNRCGTDHRRKSCPAYKKKCDKCNVPGHFSKMCKSKAANPKKFHVVEHYDETDTEEDLSDGEELVINEFRTKNRFELYVDQVGTEDDDDSWYEEMKFGSKVINLKLDTGGQANVVPVKYLKNSNIQIKSSIVKQLVSYTQHKMKVLGEAMINGVIKNKKYRVPFLVVKEDVTPILGKKSCIECKLIMRIDEIDCCGGEEVFNGIGCLKEYEYDIDLVPNPILTIEPSRRIPYPHRQAVKEELDAMEQNKIIRKIKEPTPVVSPLVIVIKKNKMRICIDLTQLNKNIRRRHYPLKTMEEIATRTKGSKFFTLLDCRRGFWQIKVTERTQKYLTFSTPWGRYCFLRLPFGLASASEVFTEIMNTLLDGIPNVEISMDDILIHSDTEQQLKETTSKVVGILKKVGLTLNKQKCIFRSQRIKFLGHIFTPHGIEADNDKIEAITKIEDPKNKKQLLRFLGMVWLHIFQNSSKICLILQIFKKTSS